MNDLISRQAERMSELKPCPFCGAPAVHWEWNGGARVDCSKWMSDGAAVNTHFVGIGAKTFEEAAKLWNERKDAQPETEERTAESVQSVPKEDLISRKAAIDALYHVDEYNGRSVEAIRNLPPAQPERKKGRWIVYKAPDEQHCGLVKCPFCGEDMIAESDEYNFCPNCGADMRGEQDG